MITGNIHDTAVVNDKAKSTTTDTSSHQSSMPHAYGSEQPATYDLLYVFHSDLRPK